MSTGPRDKPRPDKDAEADLPEGAKKLPDAEIRDTAEPSDEEVVRQGGEERINVEEMRRKRALYEEAAISLDMFGLTGHRADL